MQHVLPKRSNGREERRAFSTLTNVREQQETGCLKPSSLATKSKFQYKTEKIHTNCAQQLQQRQQFNSVNEILFLDLLSYTQVHSNL
jgi:hypothetical protein